MFDIHYCACADVDQAVGELHGHLASNSSQHSIQKLQLWFQRSDETMHMVFGACELHYDVSESAVVPSPGAASSSSKPVCLPPACVLEQYRLSLVDTLLIVITAYLL